jgi:hypothetical protein
VELVLLENKSSKNYFDHVQVKKNIFNSKKLFILNFLGIDNIYILIRSKGGINVNQRINKLCLLPVNKI